jgi:Fur family transcriptional regulator, peroxide stress response regulator
MTIFPEEIDRRLAAFMEALRETGVKATHQRIEIYREVAGTDEHPTAEMVFQRVRQRIPTVSLDTVYRTLALLERLGLVSRLHAVFESARFDGNVEAHHHFICRKCGLLNDVSSKELDDLEVPQEVSRMGLVNFIRVQMWGVCLKCSRGAGSGE